MSVSVRGLHSAAPGSLFRSADSVARQPRLTCLRFRLISGLERTWVDARKVGFGGRRLHRAPHRAGVGTQAVAAAPKPAASGWSTSSPAAGAISPLQLVDQVAVAGRGPILIVPDQLGRTAKQHAAAFSRGAVRVHVAHVAAGSAARQGGRVSDSSARSRGRQARLDERVAVGLGVSR